MVGNGAREHSIAVSLMKSSNQPKLYAFMGAKNPGIGKLSKDFVIGNVCDAKKVARYARKEGIDLAVIGPEMPLEAGVVDELESNDIPCVGPRKIVAQLETDKVFTHNLMHKYRIDGLPEFGVFSEIRDAIDFLESQNTQMAIKPAGLTGGKGVKVMGEQLKDITQANDYIKEVLSENIGKLNKLIIEEKLEGEEFTLQAFVDGKHVVGMPMVQDHKRAYVGDMGPNTGGMGSYSDSNAILPFLTQEDYDQGIQIMKKTVKAVRKETGVEYKGFLYGQFIATDKGLKVIEFNSRLGDPEAMNVLPILEDDLVDICGGIIDGSLSNNPRFDNKATVCKYMVPVGYPDDPIINADIKVNESGIREAGGILYYASVNEENGRICTSSSRSIALVGIADSIDEAERIAENSTYYASGALFHRKDIGTRELIEKRVMHMRSLRE